MPDVVGLGTSSAKLLEALEKLGVSKGAELRASDGPGGSPAAELIREFEDVLNAPLEGAATDGGLGAARSAERAGAPGAGAESPEAVDFGSFASSPDFVEAPDAAQSASSADFADSADAAARPAESGAGAKRADFLLSGEEDPVAARGAEEAGPVEPGPAERMPGEAALRRERLETRPGTAEGTESAFSPEGALGGPFGGIRSMRRVGPKAAPAMPDMAVEGKNLPEFPESGDGGVRDGVQEVARLLARITGGDLSAAELYRLQYLVGMLQVQASSGSQVSQQAAQGVESLLKQQG